MPSTLTTAQLNDAKTMIATGNVVGFYNYLASQGYGYANLGKGVVECTLLTGGSTAQNFMVQEATRRGITMTEGQVLAVEKVMAEGYINTLIKNSESTGSVNTDVLFREALDFHTKGFQQLSLPKELWTLYAPSTVLPAAKLEANWQNAIDPAQSGGVTPALNFTYGFRLDMELAALQGIVTGDLATLATVGHWSLGVGRRARRSASSRPRAWRCRCGPRLQRSCELRRSATPNQRR